MIHILILLPVKGHEANPQSCSSRWATQRETKWQARGRRAKHGPATIKEAQIAVSEVLGCDYALRALSSILWLLERSGSNRSATIFIFFFLEIP